MNILKKIVNVIKHTKYAAIITHSNPDGDTLGGSFALQRALLKLGISSDVLCKDKIPEVFNYFYSPVLLNEFQLDKYDTVIFVDSGSLSMSKELFVDIDLNKYVTINIDHHKTNEMYADYNYVDANSSTAAELVLDLIISLKVKVDKIIAEYIYTSIVTDTGQFAFSYTSAKTHRNAAFLIESGVDFAKIHKRLFKSIPLKKALLQKRMLKNMEIFEDGKVIISILDNGDFEFAKASQEDTDALINILLSIEGTSIAVLIREIDNEKCKVSFRSTEKIDVAEIAKKFGGGGHKQASGVTMEYSSSVSKDKIIKELKELGYIK